MSKPKRRKPKNHHFLRLSISQRTYYGLNTAMQTVPLQCLKTQPLIRDRYGVVLTYPDVGHYSGFHSVLKYQPSDRERIALLKAERSLLTLRVIAEHLDLSDIARDRIDRELETIQDALTVKRPRLGMCTSEEQAA